MIDQRNGVPAVDSVRLRWRKSSRSGNNGGDCVEVAVAPGGGRITGRPATGWRYLTRDSKDPGGPVLAFGSGAWSAFLGDVKAGTFDELS